jgi:hypothetical protein
MVTRVVLLMVLGLAVAAAAQEETPDVIHVLSQVVLDGESDLFVGAASGGKAIEPGEYVDYVIWGGDSTSGIRVGGLVNSAPGIRVEIPVSFTVVEQADRNLLYGRAWLMHLADSATITGGGRVSIRQPIRYDEPVLVRLGKLPDGIGISLNVTISRERISGHCATTTQPVQLVTVQYENGEMRSNHAAGRTAVAEPSPVKTWFSLPINDAASQVLTYEAEIRFSQDLEHLAGARSVDFSLIRTYTIDTLHYRLEETTPDVTYRSTYTRRLQLEPGAEYRIVIPPDTPSVRGFDIEDTLIVVPGR